MDDNDYVLAFDHFYTTNHIQILKSVLPFIDGGRSGIMPALIKYMELKYTLSLISQGSSAFMGEIHACSTASENKSGNVSNDINLENLNNIYKAIHKYLAPNEEKGFQQILSAINTMKNMREMQQMMELVQNMNSDMDLSSMMENLSSGSSDSNSINVNEMMEIMKMFGGNDNGNK